ncbi:hypothetical protein [Deinococcus hopiensis]|uniref:Uncharacterized protein n=1 Tax=Deinococcus hopiensis KR-140 TaxID=695939 RepID=A0A1W1VEX9_9DEIO|nr:hypothetical protein [Deinococcus hopiensis]SMB91846.1 hypothetical protein SAMN00790413_01317 [Deinococcus hopiensis KR-140]
MKSDAHPIVPQPAPPTPRSPYTPPRVAVLGPWQAVTLLYTVPIAPGGRSVFPPDSHF